MSVDGSSLSALVSNFTEDWATAEKRCALASSLLKCWDTRGIKVACDWLQKTLEQELESKRFEPNGSNQAKNLVDLYGYSATIDFIMGYDGYQKRFKRLLEAEKGGK